MAECVKMARISFCLLLVLGVSGETGLLAGQTDLQTVAEKSGYRATSRYAEVMAFCEKLAHRSNAVRLADFGTSQEKRKLPLLILADPPVATAEEAGRSGRLVVLCIGNIHAGEVDGKEALLALARDLSSIRPHPILKDLIVVVAPILNPDGNERVSREHRPTQAGPVEGVGTRANAQGLDLNRDFVKLETPEIRALVRFLNTWNPAVVIDTHTTNGSFHRYAITYEGPRNPAGSSKLTEYVRDRLLPNVSRRFKERTGKASYFYGNFSPDKSRWETVPAVPRYGLHYLGLRNQIGVLCESYSYAPYRDRIAASKEFVRCLLEEVAQERNQVRKVLDEVRAETLSAVKAGRPLAVRQRALPLGKRVDIAGFVEETRGNRRVATAVQRDYPAQYWGGSEPAATVALPHAYAIPKGHPNVVENLQRHGIQVEVIREDIETLVESCRISSLKNVADPFQRHRLTTLEGDVRKEARKILSGSHLVKLDQPLGTLAAYLLDPRSEDGLTAWNFFDEAMKVGLDHPILRVMTPDPILTTRARPLHEERTFNKPVTFETVYGRGRRPNLSGFPSSTATWLPGGEHYLQFRQGRLYRIHAATGRLETHYDPAALSKSLAALPAIGKERAAVMAAGPFSKLNPQGTGVLLDRENDLYFAALDGSRAIRLTKTPAGEELATFSPDGKYVAFVRANNLFVVEVATAKEHQLTSDGNNLIFNGKADWVYTEEIFDRNEKAFWWSPDSSKLVFIRFDDTPVNRFTVVDHIPTRQLVEVTPYPKAGDPNPLVKLGIASAAGGPVQFVGLQDYPAESMLLVRAGWTPDSKQVYFYVTDRAQKWLDFCTCGLAGGRPARLFRETTKAWIEEPADPIFLPDGSFLFQSERSGWKHLYHYGLDGQLRRALTGGEWEVRKVHHCDGAGGWLYFSATRDSHIAENLYRVHLAGGTIERLTTGAGDHQIRMNPTGTFCLITGGNARNPPQVSLCRPDGSFVRRVDANPIYALEEYRLGRYEQFQIPTPDGFLLEASLMMPPDFSPTRRYPVWFSTYGGPHAPVVRDSWHGGRLHDQLLANLGFIVFHCDPRTASGKGACSTWTGYKQMGVQELRDIEVAITWLKRFPYVDGSRIGMSGHSYGGFLTAYALTHSKLFAAGIAGAPVTDWRNYDSIYTERYMDTPQQNPAGYDRTSVVKAAHNLHGRLLIVHGLMDDNVHVQNTVQLIGALQRANKDFEVMFYPRSRHAIMEPHYQRLTIDFILRTLKGTK